MIKFKDFNFKLTVINELMYVQEILKPKFDIYEFVESYKIRKISIDNEGYTIIPEVKDYFENLELSKEYLLSLEEVYQDGGNEIYMQLCPFWSGEDDFFNIKKSDDVLLTPNLKKITLFYDEDEEILEQFRRKGIDANWL